MAPPLIPQITTTEAPGGGWKASAPCGYPKCRRIFTATELLKCNARTDAQLKRREHRQNEHGTRY